MKNILLLILITLICISCKKEINEKSELKNVIIELIINNKIDEVKDLLSNNKIGINDFYDYPLKSAEDLKNQSLLMIACEDGNLDFVNYLIQNNADVNIKDSYGWNALNWVCRSYHDDDLQKDRLDIVSLLIEKGINVNSLNDKNQTILIFINRKITDDNKMNYKITKLLNILKEAGVK